MTKDQTLAYQKSVREFADISHWSGPHAVTLTLKQGLMASGLNGETFVELTTARASQNYRHFLNLLNSAIFGKAAKRGKARVNSISVTEGGIGVRLHIHAIIDCPSPNLLTRFPGVVEEAWRRTQWGYGEIDVQSGADIGWLNYISKLRDKPSYADAFDWENFHNEDCRV